MKTTIEKIEEVPVMRLLFYPQSNRLVAHLHDTNRNLKYRATIESFEPGGFRVMVVGLLAALRAVVESDPTL